MPEGKLPSFDWFCYSASTIRSHMDCFPDWIRTSQPNMEYDDGGLPLHTTVTQWKLVDIELYTMLIECYPEAAQVPYTRPGANARLPLHVACDVNLETERFKLLINAYPQAASITDKKGCLPIHLINHELSSECIQMLLDANPTSTHAVDQFGKTLLHRAVEHGYGFEKFNMILSAYPEASKIFDNRNYLPVHSIGSDLPIECVEVLIRANPQSLRTPNRQQRLPLHLAIIAGCSIDLIEMMLDIYPDAISVQDEDGNLPLTFQIITKNYPARRYIDMLFSRYPESLLVPNYWGRNALHEAVSVMPNCDNDTIDFILDKAPDTCRRLDSSGLLPLHLAIMGNSLKTVKQLVALNGNAIYCRDKKNRLPLHVALQICADRQSGYTLDQLNEHSSIVTYLFELYPEAMKESMVLRKYKEPDVVETIQPFLVLTKLIIRGKFPKNIVEAFISVVDQIPRIALIPLNARKKTVLHLLFEVPDPSTELLELCKLVVMHCPQALGVYDVLEKKSDAKSNAIVVESFTPLQVACSNSSLLTTVLQYSDLLELLLSYPESAIKRKKKASLPLFLACENNAPLEIILCLLEFSLQELF